MRNNTKYEQRLEIVSWRILSLAVHGTPRSRQVIIDAYRNRSLFALVAFAYCCLFTPAAFGTGLSEVGVPITHHVNLVQCSPTDDRLTRLKMNGEQRKNANDECIPYVLPKKFVLVLTKLQVRFDSLLNNFPTVQLFKSGTPIVLVEGHQLAASGLWVASREWHPGWAIYSPGDILTIAANSADLESRYVFTGPMVQGYLVRR